MWLVAIVLDNTVLEAIYIQKVCENSISTGSGDQGALGGEPTLRQCY